MAPYLLRRLVNYAILLVIAITMAYFLAATQLDPFSKLYEAEILKPNMDPAQARDNINEILSRYNVNNKEPVIPRFTTWLQGVVTSWDWGHSPTGGSVNEEIANRVWVSVRLVTIGALLGMLVGVALGAWSAVRQYSIGDRIISILSLLIISTPVMVLAILLQLGATKANQATGTQFFQFIGETSAIPPEGFLPAMGDRLQHLLLPTLSMSLHGIAIYSRYQRNLMLDTLGSDYVRTARAKGLRLSTAVRRHALRTSLIPMTTYFAFAITGLVLGAAITEQVFGWNGMGIYGVNTISDQDINGTVAVVAFSGVCTLSGAMLSDVLVALIDPRVRVS